MPDDIRVCITGVGAVTPFGRTANDLWAALAAGRSAIAPVTAFDASGLASRIAGEIADYGPRADMDPDAASAMDRRALLAADAAIQALVDADVPINSETVSQ